MSALLPHSSGPISQARTAAVCISIYLTPNPDFGMVREHCGISHFYQALNQKGQKNG
jgi:hypothetical protein